MKTKTRPVSLQASTVDRGVPALTQSSETGHQAAWHGFFSSLNDRTRLKSARSLLLHVLPEDSGDVETVGFSAIGDAAGGF